MFRASRGARFPLWVTAFILASAALVAGITLASAHGGDAAKVHSCVNKFTGLIRIIPANGSCTLIENPLDWSQGGGAGPSGPSGPTGPAGQLNGVREYTSSSSFTVPAGVTRILVEAIGAGGGGAYRKTLYGGGGGGAGGYVRAVMTVSPGAVCTVTVGDGGAAAPNEDVGNGANGSASFVDCGGAAVVTAAAGQGGFTGSGGAGGGGTLPPAPAGQDIVRTGGSGTALVVELPGSGGTAMRGSPDVEAGDGGDGSDNDTAALGGAGLPGWVLIQW